MTPFYDDGVCQVWQGDARALPLPDESVHLIVTSPPYNARIAYDGYEDWLPWDEYWHGLIEPSLRECYRVLVHGGRIALNMPNVLRKDVGGTPRLVEHKSRGGRKWKPAGANGRPWSALVDEYLWPLFRSAGFEPRERLTWVKADEADGAVVVNDSTAWGSWCSASNPVLRAIAEPVFIASKGSYAREPGESDLVRDDFMAWSRNAWFITTGERDQYIGHPAKFPVELPRRLIKLYSYVGDTVLDPFCGSGTTLRAAKDNGRRGIGVELSPKYVALSANRCRQDLLFSEVVA